MLKVTDVEQSYNNTGTKRSIDIRSAIEEVKKLQRTLIEFLSSWNDQVPFQELWDEYVNRIIAILQVASNFIPTREWKNTEYSLNVLKRYSSISRHWWNDEIFSVDQLLDKFIHTIEEKLAIDVVELPFSIYPPKHIPEIETWEKGEEKLSEREVVSVEKYKILLYILHARGISFDNIVVLQESQTLLQSERRMRTFPYKIIYLQEWEISKTILISDEIWQATFVYEWLIREDNFHEYSKWDVIEWIIPERIIFWKTYREQLEEAVFGNQARSDDSGIYLPSSEEATSIREKAIYRNMLWKYFHQLQEAGIFYIDWVWFFSSAIPALKWPKIQWKNLRSFPNLVFNRNSKIWNSQWQIQSPTELSRLFGLLWFKVASAQEEQNRSIKIWRNTIISNKETLKSAWVVEQDWVWFFWKVTAMKFWPMIDEKKLRNFPNSIFIREQLGEGHDSILNGEQLKTIFSAIGLQIATPEQEESKFKKDSVEILMLHQMELASMGIEYDNGIWKIWELSSDFLSLEIWWIKLRNFPNIIFNRDHGIWGNEWRLRKNRQDLKKVLEMLDQEVEIVT